jgi:hypothetical protein
MVLLELFHRRQRTVAPLTPAILARRIAASCW